MRRLFIKPALVYLILMLSCGTLQAEPLAEIQADGKSVRIRIQALPLGTVLDQVTKKSGVRFSVPDSLTKTSVTASIEAKDWKEALQTLFTDFSRVEFWNEDLNKSWIQLFAESQSQPFNSGPSPDPIRQGKRVESQEVLTTVEIRPKPAWRCFSLTGPPKC